MAYPVNLNNLQCKLEEFTPGNYRLDWAASNEAPIRFKITTTKDSAIILNHIWAKAISKVTGSKYTTKDKYLRLNTDFLDDTVTFTIYPNGTVMLQGNSSHKWADRYIEKIYKLIQCDIEDNKQDLNKNEESSLLDESTIEVKGICAVCDQEDNDEMIHCDIKSCNAWVHNKCDGLSEEEAQEIEPYYCKHCRSTYNLKISPRKNLSYSSDISSKLYTSFGVANISQEIISDKIVVDENLALQYLKAVHVNLESMNEEDVDDTGDEAIEELKDITKNVANKFRYAIEETEKNLSLNLSNRDLSTSQQISTPICTQNNLSLNQPNQDLFISQNISTIGSQINSANRNENDHENDTRMSPKNSGYLSAEKKLQKSQNQNKSLNTRLQAVTKKLINTEESLAKANHEIDKLKSIIQKYEQNNVEIQNDLKVQKEIIEKSNEKQNTMINTIDSLTDKLLDKDREIDTLSQLNAKEKMLLENKCQENQQLKSQLKPHKKKNCKSALHDIKGYCQFRQNEEIEQLKLHCLKISKENEALTHQVYFDSSTKENMNQLMEEAEHKIRKLESNENALIKRNKDLIFQIDKMNKEAYTENLSKPNSDWSTIDITHDNTDDENEISTEYRDALVSTPKSRKNSESSQSSNTTNSSSCAKRMKENNKNTKEKISDMLHSLQSYMERYFNEKPSVTTQENENWNVKNHDPHNHRKRPICKFLTGKGCFSDRCIYYHPPSNASNLPTTPPPEKSTRSYSQYKKDEICWFYQRNMCRYNDSECKYQHPQNY